MAASASAAACASASTSCFSDVAFQILLFRFCCSDFAFQILLSRFCCSDVAFQILLFRFCFLILLSRCCFFIVILVLSLRGVLWSILKHFEAFLWRILMSQTSLVCQSDCRAAPHEGASNQVQYCVGARPTLLAPYEREVSGAIL